MDHNNHLALVEPNRQQSQLSAITELRSLLVPASAKTAVAELAACLTLVAPSGMSADDRTEWLKVARMAVGDVLEGPLHFACDEARKTCRFASEIVPLVIAKADEREAYLRDRINTLQWHLDNPPKPEPLRLAPEPRPLTLDEYRSWTPQLRAMARKNGWVTQEMIDAAGPSE